MIMILDVDVTAEGGIIKRIAQEGDTTTLGAKGRSILRTFFYNPSTQPAASATPPFFYNLRPQGATATLGPKGRQT